MRFAVPFSDMKRAKDGEKILKKSAGVSNVSVTKDVLKPGVKFKRTQEGKINIDKEYVANPMVERKVTATVNDLTDRKFQKARLMKDLRADAKKMSRDAFVKKNSYRVKPDALAVMWNALNEENELDESKMGELFLDMQMDAQEMDEREFIKVYTKKGFQAAELKSLYKEFSEEVVKEEVDNSLMAQATRVISQTSIKEKIDPADIDNIATADDRKAADKNIIIQLRRAQDMQGKADVTFKDKPNKKEKLDIRVINKALDMFDKMKPNDKAKMQTIIGKSYRDLLKTVQRGRV